MVPDDGKNLNRCFPGDPAGTLADRLAYDAFTQLISGSDALVDAHTGDMVEALEPFALYDTGPAEARARELASAYGLGYVIRQSLARTGPSAVPPAPGRGSRPEFPRSSPRRAGAAWSSGPPSTRTSAGSTASSPRSA